MPGPIPQIDYWKKIDEARENKEKWELEQKKKLPEGVNDDLNSYSWFEKSSKNYPDRKFWRITNGQVLMMEQLDEILAELKQKNAIKKEQEDLKRPVSQFMEENALL